MYAQVIKGQGIEDISHLISEDCEYLVNEQKAAVFVLHEKSPLPIQFGEDDSMYIVVIERPVLITICSRFTSIN